MTNPPPPPRKSPDLAEKSPLARLQACGKDEMADNERKRNSLDELNDVMIDLDQEGLEDLAQYGQVLRSSEESKIEPPTPEQWARLPWLIKALITVQVALETWDISLAFWWLSVIYR